MSIKAMTWVWEHSEMDGPRLLLLLALYLAWRDDAPAVMTIGG